jgi:adenine phosphoribosyltransferase
MDSLLAAKLKSTIRDIPDFPKKGIHFKDLTTVFKDPVLMNLILEELYHFYLPHKITKVVGIEARGFVVGSALAVKLGAGFIPARKPGKLPAKTYRKEYSLEYGKDAIEIHVDALQKNDIVLLHDDLLATGGTSKAAFDLISLFGVKDIYLNFITELSFLNGRKLFNDSARIYSLVCFDN